MTPKKHSTHHMMGRAIKSYHDSEVLVCVPLNIEDLDRWPNRTENPPKIQSNGAIKATISGLDREFRHERKL
jgi:hypothetical protein